MTLESVRESAPLEASIEVAPGEPVAETLLPLEAPEAEEATKPKATRTKKS